jgi:ketosteroid isomerase-like protein
MYHAIVRHKLRDVFQQLNAGRYDAMPDQFASRHEHVFFGRHALGGTRHTLGATRRWYDRLAVVLPDLQFDVQRIVVSGWPWNTAAAVEWVDRGKTLDGHPFSNQGVHFLTLKWGKVLSLHIYCDTVILTEVLQRNGACGTQEAVAAPILDSPAV